MEKLRVLAVDCNFASINERLRDHFVHNIGDEEMSKKLHEMVRDTSTPVELVAVCSRIENARRSAAGFSTQASFDAIIGRKHTRG